MDYGRSKLVGERIVNRARHADARAYSLRIGQVSGHSTKGPWNDSEALPLMVRSSLTLGALSDLTKTCSWIPVDKLALMALEIGAVCGSTPQGLQRDTATSVYNLSNLNTFPWPD
jgi:thioester reductase-like protein